MEDVTGYSERVWREDIITMKDELGKRHVIALHPHHEFRYQSRIFRLVVLWTVLNPLVPIGYPKNGIPTLTVNREIIQALTG